MHVRGRKSTATISSRSALRPRLAQRLSCARGAAVALQVGVDHREANERREALRGVEITRTDTAPDASEEVVDTHRGAAAAGAQRLDHRNPELRLLAADTEPAP